MLRVEFFLAITIYVYLHCGLMCRIITGVYLSTRVSAAKKHVL